MMVMVFLFLQPKAILIIQLSHAKRERIPKSYDILVGYRQFWLMMSINKTHRGDPNEK
jgi:hypothetical protein